MSDLFVGDCGRSSPSCCERHQDEMKRLRALAAPATHDRLLEQFRPGLANNPHGWAPPLTDESDEALVYRFASVVFRDGRADWVEP